MRSPARRGGRCLQGGGGRLGLAEGAVGDVGEAAGDGLDSAKPALVDLVAAAGGGLRVQVDDFHMSAFDGTFLDGCDEDAYLSQARARGVEKLSHTLFGVRGRLSVYGDQG
jgi:hypothetical protein